MSFISKSLKIFALSICILMCACEDYTDLEHSQERKVVIDGYIEQGAYPVVYLTYSSGYYDPVDSASLQKLVLTTAKVEVSDGENSEILTLFRNTEIYPPYYYRATKLKGVAGKTYHLTVTTSNAVYNSVTTIPELVTLDSVWFKTDPEVDTLGGLWIRFQDAPGESNYYRNFIQVQGNSDKYLPAYQSTIVDRAFDGKLYDHPVLQLPKSFTHLGDEILFTKGDTVRLKFCAIDRAHFDFWRSLEKELYVVGNPFGSSGNNVNSNVSGTKPVLGVWGGYGVTRTTVIFQ